MSGRGECVSAVAVWASGKQYWGGGGRSLALLCWLSQEQVLESLSFRELGGGEVGGFSSLSQVRKKKPQLSGVSEC